MTSDPQAPNAPAVYLNYEEYVDIRAHYHRVYARIKILTERGKEEFGDVEIPFESGATAIRGIEGRTIEPDGAVVPFTGTPLDKEVVKFGHNKVMEKVFSMPNVQVGSIIEYQWERQYDDWYVFPPAWDLQKTVFMHEGHYHFNPIQLDPGSSMSIMVPDGMGHALTANRLLYDQELPPGSVLKDLPSGIDLVVKDVPPIPDEPDSPPLDSFSYRLIFYYSAQYTGQEFWANEGKTWAHDVDHFAAPNDRIRQAVSQIVSPGDTEDQKARKIYAAVMMVDNTNYSRAHTEAENKAEGAKEKTAADIWDQKRGTPIEITRLFTAMARAAGLKVSEMALTRRNERILNASYLYWGQMNDEIAIVGVDGKEVFLDPGERYCEFGKLAWEHTQVMGIRETDGGTQPVLTPAADYKDTVIDRKAALQLAQNGKLDGSITLSMTGVEALRWRQIALRSDADEAKKQFDDDLQRCVPPGVIVKTGHFDALTDNTQPLVAQVNVSGSMGTATGKRVFLPSSFFEAGVKPRFAEEKRLNPVDLHYPYAVRDTVKIMLAPGLTVESVPSSTQIPFPQSATYVVKYAQSGNVYEQGRLLAVGKTVYSKDQYPELRDFFDKASAQDQQPVILDRTATAAAAAGDAGKSE
ncbi:MAG TPA: DUF3857 and transglutaminase domain-containing protein [Acidobacteriaceae bacterium]